MHRILVVEDDTGFGYILKEYLEMYAFDVTLITHGKNISQVVERQLFDVCLLDVMLPGKDGFTIAKEIQSVEPDLPFMFVTAKSLKVDKLKGFRLGCDDYIVKPIDEELLIARIQAIIHRSQRGKVGSNGTTFQIGQFLLDVNNQRLQQGAQYKTLTERECKLLQLLCEHKNQLLSRKKALREIWGTHDEFSRKSMDVFIFRLRKYLEEDERISIRNVHGKGFILESD